MTTQPATLANAIAKHGLTIRAEFIPLSRSRNAKEKDPSLNWRVTLCQWREKGAPDSEPPREIITTDYSAGCGHCPAYKVSIRELGHRNSVMRDNVIREECETGKSRFGKITLDATDVIHSLLSDSAVIDARDFESWADEFGYDTDSRKAESIYRACLDIALKLRNGLGESVLTELREAAQEY